MRRGGLGEGGMSSDFYLRYYVGHKGKFGHEFLEFEFRPDGKECVAPLVEFRPEPVSGRHGRRLMGWGREFE